MRTTHFLIHMFPRFECTILALALCASAQLEIRGNTSLQLTRYAEDANETFIDNAFLRGEAEIGFNPQEPIEAFAHVRAHGQLGPSRFLTDVRQLYADLSLKSLTIRPGRWYQDYAPSAYFGRYLFGLHRSIGSGNIWDTSTVLDGIRLSTPLFEQVNTAFQCGVHFWDFDVESGRAFMLVTANPIEKLRATVGVDLELATLQPDTARHRLAVTAAYEIIEDLSIAAEYGITHLTEAADNMWVVAGVDIPTLDFLNQLRFEVEYKRKRLTTDTDGDLGWMLIIKRDVPFVSLALMVGADPSGLGAEDPTDVGGILKATYFFEGPKKGPFRNIN